MRMGSLIISKRSFWLDDEVLSYSVGLAKPDVRIYELACERLGVSPQEAAFVGDGGSKELEGAGQRDLSLFRPHGTCRLRFVSPPPDVQFWSPLCSFSLTWGKSVSADVF